MTSTTGRCDIPSARPNHLHPDHCHCVGLNLLILALFDDFSFNNWLSRAVHIHSLSSALLFMDALSRPPMIPTHLVSTVDFSADDALRCHQGLSQPHAHPHSSVHSHTSARHFTTFHRFALCRYRLLCSSTMLPNRSHSHTHPLALLSFPHRFTSPLAADDAVCCVYRRRPRTLLRS
jgi:hypothetical protein